GGRTYARVVSRPAVDATLVPSGSPAKIARTFHAELAAVHAGAGAASPPARALVSAGRIPRRYVDLGDRVPLSGGTGHPSVSGCATGVVLRHHRHEPGSFSRPSTLGMGRRPAGCAAGL